MKTATVKLSELGDRMDAGFHVEAAHLRDRVAELRDAMTEDEAVERLSAFRHADLKPLECLMRGRMRAASGADVSRVVRDHPHLSLAIMERNVEPAIARLRERIASDSRALETLLDMTAPPSATPSP